MPNPKKVDNTKPWNNVPQNPLPKVSQPYQNPQPLPNDPLPPQNPPWIEYLIQNNLTKLMVLKSTSNNIPTLDLILSILNTIVDNIQTLSKNQNVSLYWYKEMYSLYDDKLDYDEVVSLNITKDDVVDLFVNPKIG